MKSSKSQGKSNLDGKKSTTRRRKGAYQNTPRNELYRNQNRPDFEKGKATVKKDVFSSPELQIEISGHVKLNNAPLKSNSF